MSETIEIVSDEVGQWVRWEQGGFTFVVPVRTPKVAADIKANIEQGMTPADAVHRALVPRRRTAREMSAKFGSIGGKTRTANMSAKDRRELARKAAKARWAK